MPRIMSANALREEPENTIPTVALCDISVQKLGWLASSQPVVGGAEADWRSDMIFSVILFYLIAN